VNLGRSRWEGPRLRLLRGIFGSKRDITVHWIKLHSRELSDLYYSPNSVRVKISRKTNWFRHTVRTGERTVVYKFCHRNVREKDHLEDPGFDE